MSKDIEQSGEKRVGKNLLGTFPFNVNADHDQHHHNHQQVHHRHQGSFDLALPGNVTRLFTIVEILIQNFC